FTSYTAIIVFGTLLIGTSFTITGSIRNFLGGLREIQFVVRWLMELAPSIFIFFAFLLMITAIPAGKVKLRSSLLGAFVGTILWGIARGAFTGGDSNIIQMSKTYGSRDVVPIFLFWFYIIWIIVFLALEISYVDQHGKTWEKKDRLLTCDPAESIILGFLVFLIIARQFDKGKDYPSGADISAELSVPIYRIEGILDKLSKEKLILFSNDNYERVIPSRSLNKIFTAEVIKTVTGNIDSQKSDRAYEAISKFLNAGYKTIEANTIEDLIH
ncbi:MAG: YihY/virulence factor BrkB family protein, partial [Spirochaetales bacterium]|nr:YihY/virulence factor BrkB family protein [Spirochaetales bacterium]